MATPNPSDLLSTLTPTILQPNQTIALPQTSLKVQLLQYRYGRGRNAEGKDILNAWAALQFELPNGETETVNWFVYNTYELGGHRFYFDGTRSTASLYVLPPQP